MCCAFIIRQAKSAPTTCARRVSILRHRSADTPCGYVRNIGREGEQATVLTLAELAQAQVDMFTTVFVGNSQTKLINGKLVTPRGYKNV